VSSVLPDTFTVAVLHEERADDLAATPIFGLRRVLHDFRRRKLAMVAAGVVIVGIVLAVIGPYIAPDGLEQTSNIFNGPPSLHHLLGTDQIGHDELSQVLFAMRTSVFAAGFAAIVGAVIGTVIGVISGYVGGALDWAVMRGIDALMSFPGLLLIIALIGVMGPGLFHAMIALAVSFVPGFTRLLRGEVLGARERGFVAAAKVTGVSPLRIIRRHIMPTVLPSLIVQLCLTLGLALIAEGALGYLGLGAQPPQASLGAMLQSGFTEINSTVRLVLVPGLAITVLATCLNVIADALRDALGRGSEVVGFLAAPKA
jgi:ABC-type dipeptide/oligopeptide/nickel transport system permease subunit